MRRAIVLGAVLASRVASADLLNNEGIHAHVDAQLAAGVTPELADHLTFSLEALVPILGSYELDQRVYGSTRPSGVIFDWILGGIVPLALGIGALATHGQTRRVLGWTALGLYVSTRIAVLTIGNLHVSEYNSRIELRVGGAQTPSGQLAPAVVMSVVW